MTRDMTNPDALTLLKSNGPVNKTFTRDADGKVIKDRAKDPGYYVADTIPVPDLPTMAALLHTLAGDPTLTLSLGLFKKAPAEAVLH